jgi:hypothetical protein
MRTVRYAGGTFVTGDRIATALFNYAAALANADRAVEIEVPTADLGMPDMRRTTIFVIGPASQLAAEESDMIPELEDEAFVQELERATAELTMRERISPRFDEN